MMRFKKVFFSLFLFLTIFSLLPTQARADGIIMPPPDYNIYEASQKAAIFYDSKEKKETMVLEIQAYGSASDFGWIVPVPSEPTVEKGDGEIFDTLAEMTVAKKNLLQKIMGEAEDSNYYGKGLYNATGDMAAREESTVEVVEEKRVGILDVVVLKAEEADDLDEWLKENGYEYPKSAYEIYSYTRKPSVSTLALVQDYLDDGWYFIATKVNLKFVENSLSYQNINPLRIEFETDKMVFPMKMTALSNQNVSVLLYVFADDKVEVKDLTYEESNDPIIAYPTLETFLGIDYYPTPSSSNPFKLNYGEWVSKDEVTELTDSINGDPFFVPDGKMFLTKLYASYLTTVQMGNDLILEDYKNDKEVNSGKMTAGDWVKLPFYFVVFGPYNLLEDLFSYSYYNFPWLIFILILIFLTGLGIVWFFVSTILLKKTTKKGIRLLLYFLQTPGILALANIFALIPAVGHYFLIRILGGTEFYYNSDGLVLINIVMTYLLSLTFTVTMIQVWVRRKKKEKKIEEK